MPIEAVPRVCDTIATSRDDYTLVVASYLRQCTYIDAMYQRVCDEDGLR